MKNIFYNEKELDHEFDYFPAFSRDLNPTFLLATETAIASGPFGKY